MKNVNIRTFQIKDLLHYHMFPQHVERQRKKDKMLKTKMSTECEKHVAFSKYLHVSQDHTSLLTIKLITDVNIIDKRWILLNDDLGNFIMYTSGIQETQVKNVFSHSSTLVNIPADRSCGTAYSGG